MLRVGAPPRAISTLQELTEIFSAQVLPVQLQESSRASNRKARAQWSTSIVWLVPTPPLVTLGAFKRMMEVVASDAVGDSRRRRDQRA